jgi:RsmE family RNA methyltransferase
MKTRLLVSEALINGTIVVVEGDRARYLGRVLRLRTGDAITVFDGTGPEWPATIENMTKSTVTLQVGDSREAGTESPLTIRTASSSSMATARRNVAITGRALRPAPASSLGGRGQRSSTHPYR